MFIESLVLPAGSLRGGEGRARPAGAAGATCGEERPGTAGATEGRGGGFLPPLPWPSPLSHRRRAGKAQPQPRHAASGSSSIPWRCARRRDPALKTVLAAPAQQSCLEAAGAERRLVAPRVSPRLHNAGGDGEGRK